LLCPGCPMGKGQPWSLALIRQHIGRDGYWTGRTETWSTSAFVDILFGVTIPAALPQRSDISEGFMNYSLYIQCTNENTQTVVPTVGHLKIIRFE
jgi:hypothetical protein